MLPRITFAVLIVCFPISWRVGHYYRVDVDHHPRAPRALNDHLSRDYWGWIPTICRIDGLFTEVPTRAARFESYRFEGVYEVRTSEYRPIVVLYALSCLAAGAILRVPSTAGVAPTRLPS